MILKSLTMPQNVKKGDYCASLTSNLLQIFIQIQEGPLEAFETFQKSLCHDPLPVVGVNGVSP